MKKLFILIVFLACIFAPWAQPVGIGTATPDSTAMLDLVSVNKGVLIPRIDDTANVVNPAEGLIIFNKHTQTPYYYNGNKWVIMGNFPLSSSTPTDRITYTITGIPGAGFTSLEFPVYTLTQEITNTLFNGSPGKPRFSDFSFTKPSDKNSTGYSLMAAVPTLLPSIELKVYAAGAVTPYISYRLKNIIITDFNSNGASAGNSYIENISFSFENYGFKDWVNNLSFGFNVKMRQITAY